jgi:tyrosyl-tRNA synthetase
MKDLIAELQWRGMLHDMTPGTQEQLNKESTKAYIGFDPTASSLHIGNLATIMLLVHLQRAGHQPYALVGGATGMVGDPSGKSAERNLLDEDTLRANQEGIRNQLELFLDFSGENKAVMVNNYDWFKEFGFLQFLRDVGKHLTVNYMMSKDSVKNRLETGISFTEFSYQLLQGYDFYYLNKNNNVKLQMGGSDQWGNITTGTELIRRMGGGDAYALTAPLVTKADGTKFGKSEAGNVWLDPELTSPYKFYQFWRNVPDSELARLLRVYTLLTQQEIEELECNPNPNVAKMALADEVTTRVHGKDAVERAIGASNILFGKDASNDIIEADERTLLEVVETLPKVIVASAAYSNTADIEDLLTSVTNNEIFSSKGEMKRLVKNGGLSINKAKVEEGFNKDQLQLLHNKYLLVQKGKKQHYFLIIE